MSKRIIFKTHSFIEDDVLTFELFSDPITFKNVLKITLKGGTGTLIRDDDCDALFMYLVDVLSPQDVTEKAINIKNKNSHKSSNNMTSEASGNASKSGFDSSSKSYNKPTSSTPSDLVELSEEEKNRRENLRLLEVDYPIKPNK